MVSTNNNKNSKMGNPYGCMGSKNDPINKLIITLDEVAYTMEVKWGRGTLPELVPADLKNKFLRVLEKLNQAIKSNDYDTVKIHSENMIRGWKKLDEIATQLGHDVMPNFKLINDANGVPYYLVDSMLDADRLAARMPSVASSIYTYNQIADILSGLSVANVKRDPIINKFKTDPTDTQAMLDDYIPF